MPDRPDVDQLLEAVAAFLREQVAPATDGQLSFHARVAANTLDIVRRELRLSPAMQAREAQRLRALLGPDTPQDLDAATRLLCERIASGQIGASTPGLLEHLQATAMDKLAIDQPGYAGNEPTKKDG